MARHALQKADVLLQALAFAHHRDVPPAVQLAVAGGAAADTLAQQPAFAGDLSAGRHAGGQDQAAPFIEIRPGADSIVPAHLVDRRHPCLLDWDAKIIHLPQKSVPQLPAGHPGQAGVIQDTLCLFDLVTEPPAAKPEERKPPGPGGQRGRYPGRAGAHDQQIPHERRLLSIFYYAVYRAHRRRSRGIVYLVRNPAYFAGARPVHPRHPKKVVTFANTADGGGGSGTLPVAAVSGLGIPAADGLYTNLGLLVSDQCQHSSKLAVVWTVKIVL